MSNNSENVNAKCPYYSNSTKQSITCEGIEKETKNIIKFKNKESRKGYQDRNCNYYPNGCFLTKALDDKNR